MSENELGACSMQQQTVTDRRSHREGRGGGRRGEERYEIGVRGEVGEREMGVQRRSGGVGESVKQ